MEIAHLLTIRSQVLEQYAQINADLDALATRSSELKTQASTVLGNLRQITAQINQMDQAQAALTPELVEA
jgi:uncharacterized protein (DUF3084 family)